MAVSERLKLCICFQTIDFIITKQAVVEAYNIRHRASEEATKK
jgi:hypothetical protein